MGIGEQKDMNKKLEEYTIEQLEAEIDRRSVVSSQPIMNDDPNWSFLEHTCQSVINDVVNGDYCHDNDNETYVYEAAMMALYGDDVLEWIDGNL